MGLSFTWGLAFGTRVPRSPCCPDRREGAPHPKVSYILFVM